MFTGHYDGPTRQNFEDSFQVQLAGLFANDSTPRLSGIQIKAPMYLDRDGNLIPAIEDSIYAHPQAGRHERFRRSSARRMDLPEPCASRTI